ncbi:hypothetical protein [Psychroserpens jangbogonensis]|uniref:hypothetical protein n=1 Tax=Psychroserpens jangbogonensis TaxID=1484460 RepID=UPI000B123AD9|nr:hypothetical protein [Psychroserpens jangbogonensis]
MTKSSFIIIFLIFIFSCSKNNDIEILNKSTQLKYKNTYSVREIEFNKKESYFDSLKNNYRYKQKNDTTFLVVELRKNEFSQVAWIYPIQKISSKLECEKKATIKSNEISFTFCFSDILMFIDKKLEKGNVRDFYLKELKDILLKMEQNKKHEPIKSGDKSIYKLIRNIPFELFDNKTKSMIPKTFINEFKVSNWEGYEYFLISKQEDTIASFSCLDIHHSVELWKNW